MKKKILLAVMAVTISVSMVMPVFADNISGNEVSGNEIVEDTEEYSDVIDNSEAIVDDEEIAEESSVLVDDINTSDTDTAYEETYDAGEAVSENIATEEMDVTLSENEVSADDDNQDVIRDVS